MVPQKTVYQTYSLKFLQNCERVRKERSELCKNNKWIMQQDNASVHNAPTGNRYLGTRNRLNWQPVTFPVSEDQVLKGTRFEWMLEMKQKSVELLNTWVSNLQ